MMGLFGGFNINKLKPHLKMAIHRIKLVRNKKSTSITMSKKEIATFLANGKEEKCRILVEGIVQEDFVLEAYEIIELLCDLIHERAELIKSEKECPYDMREAVCTLIWAAERTQIPELREVKKQLTKKYGQAFGKGALENQDGCVNERVMHKLSIHPPNAILIVKYMQEIATQYQIDWQPDVHEVMDPLAPIAAPTGKSASPSNGSGPDFKAIYTAEANHGAWGAPPTALPTIPAKHPEQAFQQEATISDYSAPPAAPVPSQAMTDDVPDFDELSKRFETLRRKQ